MVPSSLADRTKTTPVGMKDKGGLTLLGVLWYINVHNGIKVISSSTCFKRACWWPRFALFISREDLN